MNSKVNPWMISTLVLAGFVVGFGGSKFLGTPTLAANENKSAKSYIKSTDHIRGTNNPKVLLIEYSDTECPFCKYYHLILKQIVEKYPNDVAWIYRHNPLDFHTRSPKEAQAAECAAKLGGNEKFWEYIDRVFEVTPGNDGLDPGELPKIAVEVGLDQAEFDACLSGGEQAARVKSDLQEALTLGVRGTPHTLMIKANGEKTPLSGMMPFEQLEATIKSAL